MRSSASPLDVTPENRFRPCMPIEILFEDERWIALDLEPLARRASTAALGHVGLDPEVCEVSLLACDDARIAVLNAEFRGKPAPTNVLSWPSLDRSAAATGQHPNRPAPDASGVVALGDIAISYETCAREAEMLSKPIREHVTHLIVHGLLHLLGYDHESDADATLMEELEIEILGRMGLDDPYRDAGRA